VLFENADGNKAIIYDRSTWKTVQATEITYDEMYDEVKKASADKGTTIHGYESLAQENLRKYRTQPRVERKNGVYYIMFRDKEVVNAASIVSLNTDFNSAGEWYFKVQSAKTQKWGVVFVKKDDPTECFRSISLSYVKIESANNGWAMLNCYLPDGTVELRWYSGHTTEELPILETKE
jgi:hypothetical protein